MKKLIGQYTYLMVAAMLLSCQDNHDPVPDDGKIADSPAERKTFFSATAPKKPWRLSRLTFAAPTVVAELSVDPLPMDSVQISDLYAALPACRKDDYYTFNYVSNQVSLDFTDQYTRDEERCDIREPSFIRRGLYLSFNDSLTIAHAIFRHNDALHQFLGFRGSRTGSAYLGYEMEWSVQSLSKDSINIQGTFLQRELPDLFIQFVPLKE